MAWISVDQKLLGGKLRELHKRIGCSRNEAIGILIGLWLWGMDNASAEGLLRGCDREDIMEILAVGADKKYAPEEILDALLENGWLEIRDGAFYIHDWDDWRRHYNKFVTDKERNRQRQREFRERHAEDNGDNNGDGNITPDESGAAEPEEDDEQEAQPEPKPEAESRTEKPGRYAPEFETFWRAYPRKNDKGQAYRKYQARLNDGYRPEELLMAAERYAAECRRAKTEMRFIKHAKTFLGDSAPFLDYLPRKEPEPPSGPQDGGNPFAEYGDA